jgi:hypothetical protein
MAKIDRAISCNGKETTGPYEIPTLSLLLLLKRGENQGRGRWVRMCRREKRRKMTGGSSMRDKKYEKRKEGKYQELEHNLGRRGPDSNRRSRRNKIA